MNTRISGKYQEEEKINKSKITVLLKDKQKTQITQHHKSNICKRIETQDVFILHLKNPFMHLLVEWLRFLAP